MSLGCRPKLTKNATTIAGLVDEYEKSQQAAAKGWKPLRSLLEGYRLQDDFETTVKSAALAEDIVGKSYQKEWDGKVKRHAHQRRIKPAALYEALKTLSFKIEELKGCKSFDQIFKCVSSYCSEIKGLGPLYIYDTSLRIGAFSKKLPKQVHLQAGALIGARALGLDLKNLEIPVSAFPKSMQQLAAHEIEDFLCIYKDDLKKIKI